MCIFPIEGWDIFRGDTGVDAIYFVIVDKPEPGPAETILVLKYGNLITGSTLREIFVIVLI
jgi:hypothetical protein